MRSRRFLIAIATLWASSCAGPRAAEPAPDLASLVGPGTRPPQSELERALLPKLGDEPGGGTVTVAGQPVELGPVFAAASGRRCRWLRTSDAATDGAATACEVDGVWAFVPQVVNVERRPK